MASSIFLENIFFLQIADALYDFFYLQKDFPPSVPHVVYIIAYLIELAVLTPVFLATYYYAFNRTPDPLKSVS